MCCVLHILNLNLLILFLPFLKIIFLKQYSFFKSLDFFQFPGKPEGLALRPMKELPRKRHWQYKGAGKGKSLAWSREGVEKEVEKEGRCGWGGMNERQGNRKGWPGQVTQGLSQSSVNHYL